MDRTPVYSPHSGDPCYDSSGFAASVCDMAYRWNLDYVTDAHGNAMAYYYKQDTNFYGRNEGATNDDYIRDSYLDRIDNGFRDGNAYGTVPNRVVFGTGPRCLAANCTPLNQTTKANWRDVPYDLICASGTDCDAWSPSFFSTARLTSITAQQWSTTTSSYAPVDSYALSHTTPETGDGNAPTLWLASITRTGHDTTAGGSTTPITLRDAAGARWQDSGYLFTTRDGSPLHPDWLTRRFRRLVSDSGLPPVRLHDLRHGAASLALAAGTDLKTVQALLGHASIVLTADTYTSVLPELLADSAEATARLVLAHAARKPGRRPPTRVRSTPPKSAALAPTRQPEPKRPKRSGRRRNGRRSAPRTPHARPTKIKAA